MNKLLTQFSTLLASLFLSGCMSQRTSSDLTWDREADSVALRKSGQIVWRFNFAPAESKPNFHPLAVADGPVLSCYRPKDHSWHRGLWFSWKYVNKINYWEEDRRTGISQGKTEWKTPVIKTHADYSARISMDLDYHPTNGPVVMTEHRVIEVSPPDATGAYHIDWTLTFRATAPEVVLDRAPPVDENGRNRSGGYAGLGIRVAEELTNAQAMTGDGPVTLDNKRFRGQAPALDFSGTFGNRDAGVAILDHPGNLNSPAPWYVIDDPPMYYVSPAFLTYAPKTLHAGDRLTLRYRVVIHPYRWTPAQLNSAAGHYVSD